MLVLFTAFSRGCVRLRLASLWGKRSGLVRWEIARVLHSVDSDHSESVLNYRITSNLYAAWAIEARLVSRAERREPLTVVVRKPYR